jgi:peptide/nickel transport system permease protein
MLRHARYVLGENPVTGIAFALFVLLLLLALLGPVLAPYDPLASATASALQAPSARHWFGTDQLGRDILSRIMVATRLDLGIAGASVVLAFAIGALAGTAAGYFGGWTDRVVGRAVDTIMAFPLFVLSAASISWQPTRRRCRRCAGASWQ